MYETYNDIPDLSIDRAKANLILVSEVTNIL